ncbi:VOC family protein [Streptomyces durbertensis]|uniref:VOC family protein n=1 Tax=Streptomyces durbertensis TaxID=2448886 RepID=A0ABR6EF03_9ACTN|nr:VOC family protein [Streptomyces durbertensis]MBB1243833.1 VOC family protein [Streptomyces durbertensis]
MARMIFVNLPVKDLEVSKKFFTELGFGINPDFTDENAACVVFSDTIYAMLLTEPFFKRFTSKQIADTGSTTEALLCLSADSRAEVDQLCDKALASGGAPAGDTMEEGPMYSRSFQDPDGHHWEVMYMDMEAMGAAGGR